MAIDGQIDNVTVLPGGAQDLEFQNRILEGVSRTFALTIPELPKELRDVVANAYLLCRIADTIEDEIALTADQKQDFHQQFVRVVAGEESGAAFASELGPLLSDSTLAAERENWWPALKRLLVSPSALVQFNVVPYTSVWQ